jgi:hypothetical protein
LENVDELSPLPTIEAFTTGSAWEIFLIITGLDITQPFSRFVVI